MGRFGGYFSEIGCDFSEIYFILINLQLNLGRPLDAGYSNPSIHLFDFFYVEETRLCMLKNNGIGNFLSSFLLTVTTKIVNTLERPSLTNMYVRSIQWTNSEVNH